jgi:hypothetical protein
MRWADSGRLLIAVVLITTGLAACGTPRQQDAEVLAHGLFEAIKGKDDERALTFYGDTFFKQGSRQHWREVLEGVNSKLGDLQTYRLEKWVVERDFSLSNAGTRYKFQYAVKYARYDAMESLVLFQPLIGGDLKIVGHYISSPGLLGS